MMPGIRAVLIPVAPLPAPICPGEFRTAKRADLPAGLGGYYGEGVLCHLRNPLLTKGGPAPAVREAAVRPGQSVLAGQTAALPDDQSQSARTCSACGPFWPCVMSNSTRWFSSRLR